MTDREWLEGVGSRDSAPVPHSRSHSPLPRATPAVAAVARLADLPDGSLLGVTLADGTPVCLVRHEGTVHALHDRCTHAEFALSEGELLPDGRVECIWHGAIFDCRTGAACRGPAVDPVPVFAVRVEGDAIFVARERGMGNGERADDSAADPRLQQQDHS